MKARFAILVLLITILLTFSGSAAGSIAFSPKGVGSIGTSCASRKETYSTFLLDIPERFTIQNEHGETASWDIEHGELAGTMEIEKRQFLVGGAQYAARLLVTVPFSEIFEIEASGFGERFQFSLIDSDRHIRIASGGLKNIRLEGTSIILEGENLDFEVTVGSGEEATQQKLKGHAEQKVLIENQNGTLEMKEF